MVQGPDRAWRGSGGAGSAATNGQFLPPREVLIVLPGLLMAILLAMLDNLIVSTALPRIVGDLGGVAHLSWVVTAYILASTITTPFYGKLGEHVRAEEILHRRDHHLPGRARRCPACRRPWRS